MSKAPKCDHCTNVALVKLFVRWDLIIPIKGMPTAEGQTALFCEKHLREGMNAMEALGAASVQAPPV